MTQRLRTDLGQASGVTTATQLVWLTWCTGQTFQLSASVFDTILKIVKSLQNVGHRVTDITSFRKHLGSSVGHTLNSFQFSTISFQDYVSQGISHQLFYGDLVYKLRRVKGRANFISSGSTIVKRVQRRLYDQAIIERTIGLVLCPFTALYRSFLTRCTLTNKAVGTIWRALFKSPQRCQGPDPRPLLIVSRDFFSL